MDGQTTETPEDQTGQISIDPWAEAFASLESGNTGDPKTGTTTGSNPDTTDGSDGSGVHGDQAATSDNGESANADNPATEDSTESTVDAGGLDNPAESDDQQDNGTGSDLLGISDDELQEYRDGLVEDVRSQAINDMAQEFIKRGIRHTNGKLGASINDADICKRDEDGVPRFYNPETGREFTGDNPRRQAQEWVDDYNKELAQAFNQACENYGNKLLEQDAPTIAVLEFANTYDKLDPIRKGMFDSLIEDYEIKDGNEIIGYSCDLNKALAAVDRQVQMIQGYAKANSSNSVSNQPSSPALDMKNSGGAATKPTAEPKSLAEAMLMQQNALLESMKKGN